MVVVEEQLLGPESRTNEMPTISITSKTCGIETPWRYKPIVINNKATFSSKFQPGPVQEMLRTSAARALPITGVAH